MLQLIASRVPSGERPWLPLQRLATGDAVTLSFTAPTLWDPLVLRAHVAWHGQGDLPNRVGLAFEHRSPEAVFALYELIVTLGYE